MQSGVMEIVQLFDLGGNLLPRAVASTCVKVIPVERLLCVFVSQDHLVLFYVLDLCVFRNTLFVVSIVIFDGLYWR